MPRPRPVHQIPRLCASCARQRRSFATSAALKSVSEAAHISHVPRIAQPSLWQSFIPKPFRAFADPVEAAECAQRKAKRKASRQNFWASPYTPFLFLALLVGSNAIQIIAERREQLNFNRKTDAKITLLKEVIGKVRRGESVDVKGLLGTGDPKAEAEWEEVMKELEEADPLWDRRQRDVRARKARKEAEGMRKEQEAVQEQQRGREDGEEEVMKTEGRRTKFLM